MSVTKKVTIAALVKASKKNGFAWAGNGSHGDMSQRVHTCVVGQGINNLGGDTFPTSFYNPEDALAPDLDSALHMVYYYNDNTAKSFDEALKFMEAMLKPFARRKVPIGYL